MGEPDDVHSVPALRRITLNQARGVHSLESCVPALVGLLWLGQLAGFYRDGPTPEYETATSLFWLIEYLDLGVVIPLAILTAFLQSLPSSGSDVAAVTMLGFLTFLFTALIFMAVEMFRRGTPGASWALEIGVLVLLVPTAVTWTRWL